MAMFSAFFDESGKHKDHPVVAFTGVCATEPKIELFNDAWGALLRQHELDVFHMVRAVRNGRAYGTIPKQTPGDRNESLKPFADCINEHLELGLIQGWNVEEFHKLPKHVRAKLGNANDPYYTAFMRGILELTDYVPEDDRINLICDDDLETAWDCYQHYRGIRRADEDARKKVISLRFADDQYFPSLQAADMVAWLARKEAMRQFYRFSYDYVPLLSHFRHSQKMKWLETFAGEKEMKGFVRDAEKLK